MERITIRIPEDVLSDVEAKVERGEYANRSQAIRHGITQLDGVREPVGEMASRKRSRLVQTDGGPPVKDGGVEIERCPGCGSAGKDTGDGVFQCPDRDCRVTTFVQRGGS